MHGEPTLGSGFRSRDPCLRQHVLQRVDVGVGGVQQNASSRGVPKDGIVDAGGPVEQHCPTAQARTLAPFGGSVEGHGDPGEVMAILAWVEERDEQAQLAARAPATDAGRTHAAIVRRACGRAVGAVLLVQDGRVAGSEEVTRRRRRPDVTAIEPTRRQQLRADGAPVAEAPVAVAPMEGALDAAARELDARRERPRPAPRSGLRVDAA